MATSLDAPRAGQVADTAAGLESLSFPRGSLVKSSGVGPFGVSSASPLKGKQGQEVAGGVQPQMDPNGSLVWLMLMLFSLGWS